MKLQRPALVPAITVAMSMRNAAQFLAPAICSVLAQSLNDFEFLILDDGSTDDSLAIAQGFAEQDPRIRIIARENRGLVTSLNQLLAEARAPLVARFDADDICLPDRFAQQASFLTAHPDHGLVGANTLMIDALGQPAPNPPFTRPISDAQLRESFESGPNLCHSVVMYRRDLVLALGGYRAAYRHAEDYDLWLRLAEVTKLANLPQPLLRYRLSPDQVSARHVVEQARNTAIAWLAHRERNAGRPDPTSADRPLPAAADLDGCFGPGAADYVNRCVVERTLFDPGALAGDGWDMLLRHAAANRGDTRLWRAAARLLRAGKPLRAGRLAAALLGLAA